MSHDLIDSRDLIAERSDLLADCDCSACDGDGEIDGEECARCDGHGHARSAEQMPEDSPERERVEAIDELATEVFEWEDGATLIHEDYFEDYARQVAEDIGAIDPNASWPLSHIDWSAAADALKMDYVGVEFDGETYYVRQ